MTDFVFGNAYSVREVCSGTYKTEAALQATIVAAMAVAIALAGTFTCNVSLSGQSAQDVQNVCRLLTDMSFGVTISGSTLTITW